MFAQMKALLVLASASVAFSAETVTITEFSQFPLISGCERGDRSNIIRLGDCKSAIWEGTFDAPITEICAHTLPDESNSREKSDFMSVALNGITLVTTYNDVEETVCSPVPQGDITTNNIITITASAAVDPYHLHMRFHDLVLTTTTTSCFHADGRVHLEDGSTKRLADLNIGDKILGCDKCENREEFAFSPVTVLPHAQNEELAAFLTLTIGDKTVEMTNDHFIPRCDHSLVTAAELVKGDCLLTLDGKETLVDVKATAKSGVYTAITDKKFIVVDDVVASPYSKVISSSNYSEKDFLKYALELQTMRQHRLSAERKARKLAKMQLLRGGRDQV